MEKTFVGICLTSGGGAEWPKVFQSGFEKLKVSATLGPAQVVNRLRIGDPYEITFKLEDIKESHPGTGVFILKTGTIAELNKEFRL